MESKNITLTNEENTKFYKKIMLIPVMYLLMQIITTLIGGFILGFLTAILQLPSETFMGPPPMWYQAIILIVSNTLSFFVARSITKLKFKKIKSPNKLSQDFKNGMKFAALFAGYLCIEDVIIVIFNSFTNKMGFNLFNNTIQFDVHNPMELFWAFIMTCISAPLFEELIFRGCIMNYAMEKTQNPKFAIVISAIIFGLIHVNGATSLLLIPMGLIFGYTYYKTNSLIPSMILHCMNNCISLLQLLISGYSSHATIMLILLDALLLLSSIIMIAINKTPKEKMAPIEKGMMKKTFISVNGFIFLLFIIGGFVQSICLA